MPPRSRDTPGGPPVGPDRAALGDRGSLERVVALAGLGAGSQRDFAAELGELAEELEAAFPNVPEAVHGPPGPEVQGLEALRADELREGDRETPWQAAAPALRDGWLRVPPVRGSGDEDPRLPFEAAPAGARTPRPAPPHAPVAPHPFEDATALAAAIEARAISPAEVRAHYARALSPDALSARLDPWNALVDVDRGAAPRAGTEAGALFGVPLAVKTNICVEGFTTNCASRALAGWRAPYTATAVRRLARAGVALFASANMDEFAMGSSGERSGYGATRNPWSPPDRALVPGGSSSGSAAAVAAGLVPVALGTDAGGSIRQPAALCGVTGLRPSRGRVSRFGVVAFASSFDAVGPVARSARDLAAVLHAMDGADPRDASRMARWPDALPLPISEGEGAGHARSDWAADWVIGIPRVLIEDAGLEPEVAASFAASLAELEAAGATLVDLDLGDARKHPGAGPDAALSAYHVISCAEAASNLARLDGMRFGPHAQDARSFKLARRDLRERTLGLEVRRRVLIGTLSLAREGAERLFGNARRSEAATRAAFARALERCHVIALPTSPTTAFPIGARLADPMAMYRADLLTVPASLAGVAAVTLPGPTDGLPVGLQLVSAPGTDLGLLALAARYQAAHPHHLRVPS